MLPMMLFFGTLLVVGVSLPFDLMPIVLPTMLALFVAFAAYYYFKGFQACQNCGGELRQGWKACPQCTEPRPNEATVGKYAD